MPRESARIPTDRGKNARFLRVDALAASGAVGALLSTIRARWFVACTRIGMRNAVAPIVRAIMNEGIPSRPLATRALYATLRVLGERLTDDEALVLTSALPPELARLVDQREHDSAFDASELYERCARYAQASIGEAHELVDVVLRVVGRRLDPDARGRVARGLPSTVGDRMRTEHLPLPPPYAERLRVEPRTTLSSGRPGSRHPISEARVDSMWTVRNLLDREP